MFYILASLFDQMTATLTKWQKCKTVSSHGELVEAGQLAEMARHTPQPVAVHSEVLQRKAQVKPLGQS